MIDNNHPPRNRRQFLQAAAVGAGIGTTGAWLAAGAADDDREKTLCFGLVTDVHFADVATKGSRHYRDSADKLRAAVETFNRRKLPFVVELGDFIDAGPDKAATLEYLRSIRKIYEGFSGRRHFVLGNHCLDRMTKADFLANCGTETKQTHYSFDHGGYHFVILDADFKQDGTPYANGDYTWTDTWIPESQRQWLADDLKQARPRPTIVFAHQNLDDETDPHGIKNAPEVRKILEAAGNVLAVFQGHKHSGGYRQIAGIHYITLRAMVEGPTVENNAYAIVTLGAAGKIELDGFGRQKAVAP